ncbi:NAD(P)/FAD-dependent oxidoreductase [Alkalibacter mobilis]|uniref:NAD(P)/FAD-dependent oxidoreductase n=1 Tax=Alkalibacter mobilis TaxID=2787712 RepID=UPI00189EFE10|nr:FAD-dependent oxidoreductase [Alkalibacter mobilis]MBF7095528.1 NAD(P)/FAD-dependent oxidoreductase [Alkalibacter mobilis]
MNILIIGNGIAGLSAAEEIRKIDNTSKIDILTQEPYLTYYRTKLSHYLSKDFTLEEVLIHPEQWYAEKEINVHLDTKAENIDVKEKKVTTDGDAIFAYDKLLLANGSSSFVPPVKGSDKEGVFSLRSLADALEIQSYSKKSKKATVIGGGLLGLEAANSLKALGLEVTVVEFAPRLLPRQLDEDGSAVVKNIIEGQGINLILDAQVEEIKGDPADLCLLKNGEAVETDLVLFSAGVRSNIQIPKDAGLETDRAVIVNEFMETSAKDVYAAGDVAEFNKMSFNIWPISVEQGKIAGRNMAGKRESYDPITPSNMLNILNIKAFSIGDFGSNDSTITSIKDGDETSLRKVFFKEGKLVGGILINDISLATKLKSNVGDDFSELLKKDINDTAKLDQIGK